MNSELSTQSSFIATGSDDVLVRVEGVSKKFCRSLKKSLWYGVCDIAGELSPFAWHGSRGTEYGARRYAESGDVQVATSDLPQVTSPSLRDGEFWAVNDVSFELRRGECLGLIGHNGAGKTTLLKMLNGLIKPDTGRIEMNGSVGALIALGAGFNPVLTGRENIYINGAVLGLSRQEVDEKIEDIIDFAEIREFIDMPVQSYSSGMAVRLGFSIASALSPDVLLLDEVLAVGDVRFVVKCLNRLRDIASEAAVILVSHNMQTVAGFCTRVLLMQNGEVAIDTTKPIEAVLSYCNSVKQTVAVSGAGGARVLNCQIQGSTTVLREGAPVINHGASAKICLMFEVDDQAAPAELQINISDQTRAQILAIPILREDGQRNAFLAGRHSICVSAGNLDLNPGIYFCTVTLRAPKSNKVWNRTEGLASFRISDSYSYGAAIVRPAVPGAWAYQGADS
jgi:lipopolysaccharide transport system ATP-binding protein